MSPHVCLSCNILTFLQCVGICRISCLNIRHIWRTLRRAVRTSGRLFGRLGAPAMRITKEETMATRSTCSSKQKLNKSNQKWYGCENPNSIKDKGEARLKKGRNDETKATQLLLRNRRRPRKPLCQNIFFNFIYGIIYQPLHVGVFRLQVRTCNVRKIY